MKKHLFFCFALFIMNCINTQAQQGLGEVIINAGIAYSPTFNGAFAGYGSYPIGNAVSESPDFHEGITVFTCSSVAPNLSGTVDVGLSKHVSIGLAASTQNEVVNWTMDNQAGYPNNSDQITRTNIAVRLTVHFGGDGTNMEFDPYCGFRVGESLWNDIPSPYNVGTNYGGGNTYFLTASSVTVPSCQVFGGIRRYFNENIGLQLEIGIGSPYLVEGGITLRARSKKNNTKTAPAENQK